MRDMTQDQYYIDIHNAIDRVKEKVKYYNASYDNLSELERERFHQLQERLKHYNQRFNYIEEWFGIEL